MKKLIAVLTLGFASITASADPLHGYHGPHGGYPYQAYGHHGYYGGGHSYHNGGIDFVAPMIIGGVVGYAISEAHRQPAIVYQQAPTVYQTCTAWVETIDQYGNITRTRTCY